MKKYMTYSENETKKLAAEIAAVLVSGDVVALRGGLGSGKTAFVSGLALGLGFTGCVSSPTFALVHEYRGGRLPLFHFDMYRVGSWDDLYSAGFDDYLAQGGITAVEWSENIKGALPENPVTVTIERLDENTRRITVEGSGRF